MRKAVEPGGYAGAAVSIALGVAAAGLAAWAALAVWTPAAAGDGNGKEQSMKENARPTDAEWKAKLTPEQYRVMRCSDTERPFSGAYWNHHGTGVYLCAACGTGLFESDAKFDSGTGWPSFWKPAGRGLIEETRDTAHGMVRTEVRCSRCGGHLGHLFDDGPAPSGLRYCINSAALNFAAREPAPTAPAHTELATFGAGCFWCTEAAFRLLDGVVSVKVGYMGGKTPNPTYEQVCRGTTGHAEVGQVAYDPARVPYTRLLEVFWQVHDPTSLNRQGADEGTQYRSAIFYHDDAQKRAAEEARDAQRKKLGARVVTEIVPAAEFYEAEDYHQQYFENNPNAPYCRAVVAPKVEKARRALGLSR